MVAELTPLDQQAPHVGVDESAPLLVPIDLSSSSATVLTMAGELAAGLRSSLLVLHVVHDSADHPGQYRDPTSTNYSTPMVEVARKKLHSLVFQQAESRPELECLKSARIVLLEGLPSRRILETAEAEHPRMIVMGSHSRNGFSRVLTGSVSEAVLRASRVSVTVVKGPPDS